SGSTSSAARAGMRAAPDSSTPSAAPKITSSTIRCRSLRRPSRPRHRPAKNERTFTGLPLPAPGAAGRRLPSSTLSDLLLDPRRLAREIPQVVERGAAHTAAPLDHDVADRRALGLQHTLHTLAVRDLAHGERGIQSAVAAGYHDSLVGLHALAVTLDHLHLHDHGIAGLEVRNLTGHAPLVQILDYLVHVTYLDSPVRPPARPAPHSTHAAPPGRAVPARAGRGGGARSARARARVASGRCPRDLPTIAPAAPRGPRRLPVACSAAS